MKDTTQKHGLKAVSKLLSTLMLALLLAATLFAFSACGTEDLPKDPKEAFIQLRQNTREESERANEELNEALNFGVIESLFGDEMFLTLDMSVDVDYLGTLDLLLDAYSDSKSNSWGMGIDVGLFGIDLLELQMAAENNETLLISVPGYLEDVYMLNLATLEEDFEGSYLEEFLWDEFYIDWYDLEELFTASNAASVISPEDLLLAENLQKYLDDISAEFENRAEFSFGQSKVKVDILGTQKECDELIIKLSEEDVTALFEMIISGFTEFVYNYMAAIDPSISDDYTLEEAKDELEEIFSDIRDDFKELTVSIYNDGQYILKYETSFTYEDYYEDEIVCTMSFEKSFDKENYGDIAIIIDFDQDDDAFDNTAKFSISGNRLDENGIYNLHVSFGIYEDDYDDIYSMDFIYDTSKTLDNLEISLFNNYGWHDGTDYTDGIKIKCSFSISKENGIEMDFTDIIFVDDEYEDNMGDMFSASFKISPSGKKIQLNASNAVNLITMTEDDFWDLAQELENAIMKKALSWDI